jgi:hypothetical protein
MRTLEITILLILALALGGCDKPPPEMGWYKPGSPAGQFERDKYGCLRDASTMFPPTAGVDGTAGRYGAVVSSYDISEGSRNRAWASCMNSKGWKLVPQTAQPSGPVTSAAAPTAATVLTCKGNTYKASPSSPPKQINGGVLRFQVTPEVITVTYDGTTTTSRVSGSHGDILVASKRDGDGSGNDVHVSLKERFFAIVQVVNGQAMGAITGPCS